MHHFNHQWFDPRTTTDFDFDYGVYTYIYLIDVIALCCIDVVYMLSKFIVRSSDRGIQCLFVVLVPYSLIVSALGLISLGFARSLLLIGLGLETTRWVGLRAHSRVGAREASIFGITGSSHQFLQFCAEFTTARSSLPLLLFLLFIFFTAYQRRFTRLFGFDTSRSLVTKFCHLAPWSRWRDGVSGETLIFYGGVIRQRNATFSENNINTALNPCRYGSKHK